MYPRAPSHSTAIGPGVTGPSLAIAENFSRSDQVAHKQSAHAPSCGGPVFAVDPSAVASHGEPTKRTQYPYVTGASVIALKYKDGIVLASDTLGSYGRTKRYKDVQRMAKVNNQCIIGAGGEISDFSYIVDLLDQFTLDDYCADDGIEMGPAEVHSVLCRIMYNRRTKFDPLWNTVVIGGIQDGKPFLGTVGMIGTHYVDDFICSGMGQLLARPLLNEQHRPDMSEEEAVDLLKATLRVLFYRDCSTINKFQIARVNKEGVTISDPFALDVTWNFERFQDPSKFSRGGW